MGSHIRIDMSEIFNAILLVLCTGCGVVAANAGEGWAALLCGALGGMAFGSFLDDDLF